MYVRNARARGAEVGGGLAKKGSPNTHNKCNITLSAMHHVQTHTGSNRHIVGSVAPVPSPAVKSPP